MSDSESVKAPEAAKPGNKKRKIIIACAAVLLTAALAVLFILFALPAIKYSLATGDLKKGNYDKAISAFEALGDYRESGYYLGEARIKKINPDLYEKLTDPQPGGYVNLGRYEINNFEDDGPDEIDWRVLRVEEDRVLLVSMQGLETVKFKEQRADATWETSDLRKWLNGEFYENAFSKDEKAVIAKTDVKADENPYYPDVDQGKDTSDRVFLLSAKEALEYFESDADRSCTATDHARENGAHHNDNGTCWWWLRTRGNSGNAALVVYGQGDLSQKGLYVDREGNSVRPAIWISLY